MIKKFVKSNKKLYFLLYPIYLRIKYIKNRKLYFKHFCNTIDQIKKSNSNNKVFYIGIPIHNNLGDLAQYQCIKDWIDINYNNYDVIEIVDSILLINYKNIIGIIKKYTNSNDIFIFQSGYRTTDIANFEGECTHRIVLKNFDNKIIVFPQTVNFETKSEAKKSSNAYNYHNNYTFLARDNISFESAKMLYNPKRVFVFPDIVTTMIGNYGLPSEKKEGILLCLRNDEEKLYTDAQFKNIIEKLKNITKIIDITDTNSPFNYEFDKSKVKEELDKKIKQFSKYKLIITDRYHGTIFSLISNTYVIVLNSTDHKLSSGVDWFKGIYDNSLCYCDSLEKLYEISETMYHNVDLLNNTSYFKEEYYDKLFDIVNRSDY